MAYDEKTLKRDGSGITPVPQHFNPVADAYEPILGRNGASRVELYGPDGNPISTSSGKLAVRAAEIESLLNDIKGKDYATQTTLSQILAKIIAAPATEAKQTAIELILNSLDGKDYSTLAKQNEILVKLAALETKLSSDPATQTTLAAILAKIIDAPATEAKQTALAALIGEVQASPTANTLLARLKSLEDKIDAITDGTSPAVTQLSGSNVAGDGSLKVKNSLRFAHPKSAIEDVTLIPPWTSPQAVVPMSIGHDGLVYCGDNGASGKTWRSADGFVTAPVAGADFSAIVPGCIVKYVTKTKSGYVVVINKVASDITQGAAVYYSTTWDSGYTKVLDLDLGVNAISCNFYNGDVQQIGLIGEYTQKLNTPHKLYITTDGGATWRMAKATVVTDPTKSCHWHCAMYDPYNGRVYAACGDGANRHLFESRDLGVTWSEITVTDNPYGLDNVIPDIQPVCLIPQANKITVIPDATVHPGIWSLVKDRDYIATPGTENWTVQHELTVNDAYDAGVYFAGCPYAQAGEESYILYNMPSSSSVREITVVGTGDGGNSWHKVWSYQPNASDYESYQMMNGIVGPDASGYLYAYHSYKPTGSSATVRIVKFKTPQWKTTNSDSLDKEDIIEIISQSHLINRRAVETTVFNAVAITHTTQINSTAIDVSQFKTVSLIVLNTLDNAAHDVDLVLTILPGAGAGLRTGDGKICNIKLDYATYGAAAHVLITSADLKALDGLPNTIKIAVKAANAPTSGAITVVLKGVPN